MNITEYVGRVFQSGDGYEKIVSAHNEGSRTNRFGKPVYFRIVPCDEQGVVHPFAEDRFVTTISEVEHLRSIFEQQDLANLERRLTDGSIYG